MLESAQERHFTVKYAMEGDFAGTTSKSNLSSLGRFWADLANSSRIWHSRCILDIFVLHGHALKVKNEPASSLFVPDRTPGLRLWGGKITTEGDFVDFAGGVSGVNGGYVG